MDWPVRGEAEELEHDRYLGQGKAKVVERYARPKRLRCVSQGT